jgi:two-component system, cell cycle sensor histidine kinase and response regulator CckA
MSDQSKTKGKFSHDSAALRQPHREPPRQEATQPETEAARHPSAEPHRTVPAPQTILICHYLPDSTITFANEAFCRFFGKDCADLVGTRFPQIGPDEDRDAVGGHFSSLNSQNPVLAHEHRVVGPDGKIRCQQWTDRGIFDEQGILKEIQGVGMDVTDRKDAEDALLRARDELERLLQERKAELSLINDTLLREIAIRRQIEKNSRRAARALRALSECSQALARATEETSLLNEICRVIVNVAGYPRAWVDFLDSQGANSVHSEAQQGFGNGSPENVVVSAADTEIGRLTQAVISTGQTQIVRSSSADPSMASIREELIAFGHASAIWLPLVVEDRTIGALAIPANEPDAFDGEEVQLLSELAAGLSYGLKTIRRRKEQERERRMLRESEERFRKVFQQGPLGIAIIGLDCRWITVNATLCGILGYTESELTQLTFFDITHPSDFRKAVGYMERLVRAEIPYYKMEKRCVRKGGKVVWINFTGAVVRDEEGLPIHFVAMLEDITKRKRAEIRIAESHEFNEKILDSSPVGIGTYRVDGQMVSTNDALCSIIGASREAMLKQNFREIAAWTGTGMVDDADEVLSSGEGRRREIHVVTSFGKEVWLDCRFSRFRFGRRPHLLVTVADSSELKRVEQELRASEEKYRELAELLPQFVYEINDMGYFTFANAFALKVTGYTWGDLKKGLHIRDVFIPEDAERVVQDFAQRLSGEKSGGHEYTVLAKDGSAFVVVTHAAPIVHDGVVVGMRGFAVDISERKKAAEALQASEERFRVLTESSPIGITIFQQGRRVYVNPAFVKTYGYATAEEILNLEVEDLYDPEFEGIMKNLVESQLAEVPIPYHLEAKGRRKNRESFDVSIWLTRTQFQEEPAILSFVVDISDEKSLRAQLAHAHKMEAIGTLAGGIAHDFNNLLTIILGFSELLLVDTDEQDPSYGDLKKIYQAAVNGAELVQRILAFSRKTDFKPLPLNLNHQIEQVKKLLTRTIPKMITIKLVLAGDLSTVNADPVQVEQILMNLAVNAKDAMPDGGKLLLETSNVALDEAYCRLHLGVKACDHVMLSVSDTGQGMDKVTLQHVFEPFYTTKETGKGTGLGLAIVYGIVQQHGGHITCSSEPGQGTTFKIFLPAIPTEPVVVRPIVDSQQWAGSETILLVDDEEFIRDLGRRILERSGYKVLTAVNGKDALGKFQKDRDTISLVILDLIMPEMGGFQCLEELLKIDPQLKVLVASGHYADVPAKEAYEARTKGFVKKPYDIQHVLQTVRSILDSD